MQQNSFPGYRNVAYFASSDSTRNISRRHEEWTNADIEQTANALSALAHPLRLSIVSLLADGERSVGELCEVLWSSQPNISHHLWILHSRRLVSARKDAQRMFYMLTDARLGTFAKLIPSITD